MITFNFEYSVIHCLTKWKSEKHTDTQNKHDEEYKMKQNRLSYRILFINVINSNYKWKKVKKKKNEF